MASANQRHNARSLFDLNIQSAEDCLNLSKGLSAVRTTMNTDWLLRAAIVFIVSALDTYFHDKIKYSVGNYTLAKLPNALAKFQVSLSQLNEWQSAERKGNVLRNWVTEYYSVRPLQSQSAIAEALKLIGIEGFWDSIEKDSTKQKKLKDDFGALVKRRNQIAHEGDREASRGSGKKLRKITEEEIQSWIDWTKSFIHAVEKKHPT
ncbi:hypothetical protein JWG45_03495 [Leptospira sp. 201903070]|uniref:RiboL-PSP-HEPN domain-containing protein n=1 Tax=Leptospira ainlahdjerensis TaxID=2810033 RepID=A0ABS2U776_9LEPT|nr:HEPN domain-containing protein [Leptospira ainlahdjerensis]MBM9576210.1 hypothetical protein [Leptospira ainlahdjerensis]